MPKYLIANEEDASIAVMFKKLVFSLLFFQTLVFGYKEVFVIHYPEVGNSANHEDEYCQDIQALTEEINSYPESLCPVELRNERGLFLVLSQEYDAAIEDFEYVMNKLEDRKIKDRSLFASVLWGRFLAYAFSDEIEKSLSDLFLIRNLFLHGKCNCQHEIASSIKNQGLAYSVFQIAEFADPNEKLTPEQCKQRVKATAIAMRALCTKIPNSAVRFAAETSIFELEEKAYACCEREHWTECLSPIVDAWKYLKECMDKGVRYAPYVIFPSSNIQSNKLEKVRGAFTKV